MKYTLLAIATALALSACSTNPDGTINWADNPLNNAAGKIDDGLKAANRALEPKEKVQKTAMPSHDEEMRSGGGFGRNGLAPGIHESGMSYKTLLELGYIKRNPEYPKYSKQRYVFTADNCTPGHGCYRPNNFIAPRP